MSGHMTLHVRLIKGCNADCSYCSSWEETPSERMSPDAYRQALIYIRDHVLPVMGASGPASTLTIQYVGGEILLYPASDLSECVDIARRELAYDFGRIIDGVQSNLIASKRRVMELDRLFMGRIGTSVDGRGTQRTVKGNPEAYRKIVNANRDALKERRRNPGAIFVVDRQGLDNLGFEMMSASDKGHSLVLRPVFDGGRTVESASVSDLVSAFGTAFDQWVMKSRVPVEPFIHLLKKRLQPDSVVGSVCPFQRNCAEVSLDLEPDGTLYTCLDMADSKQVPLGNALSGTFDQKAYAMLMARKDNIDPRCKACPYFAACQGGCMSEAIHHTGSVYGRSDLCAVWTAIFKRIDQAIAFHGVEAMKQWVSDIRA
jgi:radical SAM protein with 4Fe4S-binding SPASM domain